MEASASTASASVNTSKSALQDNIESKGKNAYYFAHAHKANGPKWDGKVEPKLLSSSSMGSEDEPVKIPAFEYHKSNITSYAFLDEGRKIKVYVTLEGVGEKCKDEDVSLDFTEQSFCLVVKNYEEQERCLSFGKLSGLISDAKFKLKTDKILLVLTKKVVEGEDEPKEWHTLANKGTPDHELV
jgi:CS domain